MASEFDDRQAEYWARSTNLRPYDHPVVQAFAEQRIEFLARLLEPARLVTALDVGCGDGFGMHYMRSLVETIHGCDKSPRMLEANPAAEQFLKQCDAYKLPYEDSQFDLVYCWELLHHVAHPERVVAEMARVADKIVLLCEPNCWNPAMAAFGMSVPEERGLFRFTPAFPSKLMREAGLTHTRRHEVGWFTPNRTPQWLANVFLKLPFRIPIVGMYTITIGSKETKSRSSTIRLGP